MSPRGVAVLLLAAAASLTHLHLREIDRAFVNQRQALHQEILAGTAPAPYRYRVLVPVLAEAVIRPLTY